MHLPGFSLVETVISPHTHERKEAHVIFFLAHGTPPGQEREGGLRIGARGLAWNSGLIRSARNGTLSVRLDLVDMDMRVKRYARNGQRLADYVLATLEASKLDRMEGNTSTLARRLNPPSVRIEDVSRVPAEFMRTPPAPAAVPDKTAIAIALKAKREVAACRLIQGARLVRT